MARLIRASVEFAAVAAFVWAVCALAATLAPFAPLTGAAS